VKLPGQSQVNLCHTHKVAVDSSHHHEFDVHGTAISLLQLSPIVLAFIYIFEYSYAFQFLGQFGVTPEEVGVSQIKFLTRAALLTLLFVSVYGSILVVAVFLFTLNAWAQRSARTGFLYTIGRSVDRSNSTVAKQVWRIVKPARSERRPIQNRDKSETGAANLAKQSSVLRSWGTLSFVVAIAIVISFANAIGLGLKIKGIITLLVAGAILGFVLFAGWRRVNVRQVVLALGAAFTIILLELAGYFGGTHQGDNTATTGQIPALASALGVDIVQVHPTWLNKSVGPQRYKRGQDLIELGSDDLTVFLYDCSTRVTYRIPLDDVVLTYPLLYNKTNSAVLRRLYC
jgi:hypothetical protein